jgi:hypothetical protein
VEKPYAKYHTREKSPWKGEALNPVFSVKALLLLKQGLMTAILVRVASLAV